MTLKKLLFALSALVAATAYAQAPLGTVTTVEGVVTATQGTTGVTVVTGTPVQEGMRFVTTSSGRVVLRMNNGCVVTVPAGSAITVLPNQSCQQLSAAVVPLAPSTAVMGQSGMFSNVGVVNGIIAVGAVGILLGIIDAINDNDDDDDQVLSAR
jgi:hypothetical protein